MFDNNFNIFDNSFVKIFVVLIGIAFLIYRLQLWMLIINSIRRWKKKEDEFKSDQIKLPKFEDEMDNFTGQDDNIFSVGSKLNIKLQKIVKSDNLYQVYFSIVGSIIIVKDIISKHFKLISFDPKGVITNDSIARLCFTNVSKGNDSIVFEIIFEDEFKAIHSKKYLLSISENSLTEIK